MRPSLSVRIEWSAIRRWMVRSEALESRPPAAGSAAGLKAKAKAVVGSWRNPCFAANPPRLGSRVRFFRHEVGGRFGCNHRGDRR